VALKHGVELAQQPPIQRRGRDLVKPLPYTPGNDGIIDPRFGLKVFKLLPGDLWVTRRHEVLTTVVGACIAVCVRDPTSGVGGMNHFMLPTPGPVPVGKSPSGRGRADGDGADALRTLIDAVAGHGAARDRLEAQLFGGAAVGPDLSDVGHANIEFARQFLKSEGIALRSESVGDVAPRRVNFFPATGEVMLRRLRVVVNDSLALRERAYLDSLRQGIPSGTPEVRAS
jgi:chemotaxis protein CheD